jgi:hypothetical protein
MHIREVKDWVLGFSITARIGEIGLTTRPELSPLSLGMRWLALVNKPVGERILKRI